WISGDKRLNLLPRPPGLWRKALMGLEGVTKGVRAGVAGRAGHFANAVARIAEQLLGLREPNLFQELVEGHTCRLTEQGGEIGGIHLHGRGQFVQADRAVGMPMHVVEHRLDELLRWLWRVWIPNRGGSDAPKPPRDGRRRGKRV